MECGAANWACSLFVDSTYLAPTTLFISFLLVVINICLCGGVHNTPPTPPNTTTTKIASYNFPPPLLACVSSGGVEIKPPQTL